MKISNRRCQGHAVNGGSKCDTVGDLCVPTICANFRYTYRHTSTLLTSNECMEVDTVLSIQAVKFTGFIVLILLRSRPRDVQQGMDK